MSRSLELARPFLGKTVNVIIVSGITAPDGAELDAYVLGVREPLETFTGTCVAIIHRREDDDDKLIVVPESVMLSNEEILEAVHFQEQFFDHTVLRA